MKFYLALFFFVASFCSSISQSDLVFGKNHLLFFDAQKEEPVLIINDSILYHGNNFEVKTATSGLNKGNLGMDIPYCFVLEEDTYMVSNGCGPVYLYNNFDFARIDKSFAHRNQHYAVPFAFNDEIYLFGGYGLFSHKNIITKYNKAIGEWTQVQTKGNDLPTPRFKAFHYTQGDYLYVFGGFTQNPNRVQEQVKVDDGIVWQLHLPTMNWKKAGEYNAKLFGSNPYKSFQANDKLYILYESIYEIDIDNNILKTYGFNEWKGIEQIIYDPKTEKVIYTYRNTITDNYSIISESLDSFLGKEKSEISFFDNRTRPIFLGLSVLLIVLAGSTIVYKRRRKVSNRSRLTYNEKEETFYYKKKALSNLNENETRLLKHLFLHQNKFTPLNDLNEILQNEKDESFNAISKRREVTLANLLFKLSAILHIPKGKILVERRNPKDRRLKEVMLIPEIFRVE
ncbi:kelch repeat-containing protein [Aequorivita sp. KMM 9714]|uniref:kelch repeat-containing protein n=1 Tax=Aequorivita sp. KMM 9714 TaxID=2707173 RepID=UPI0013ED68E6|nr:kelch repeat-containing protein [Aequorivita sp. KMM 9714]NGX85150.1 hypothetical protein [Aequorivita sp. KMM 9714]